MVSRKYYSSKTETYWKGKKVRTLRELNNGWIAIPKGMICEIRRKFSGFDLTTDKCESCGVKIHISRVNPESVMLVDEHSE